MWRPFIFYINQCNMQSLCEIGGRDCVLFKIFYEICWRIGKRMKIRYVLALSLILLIGYLGFTIQTQKGAYVSDYQYVNIPTDAVDHSAEVANFVKNFE